MEAFGGSVLLRDEYTTFCIVPRPGSLYLFPHAARGSLCDESCTRPWSVSTASVLGLAYFLWSGS